MNPIIRRLSVFVAILLALSPLIIDENTRIYWPLYIAFVSLVWIIISEQLNESYRQSASNTELQNSFRSIIHEIRSQSNDAPSVIQFNDSVSARAYIVANAKLCKRIYNTRIGSRLNDERDSLLLKTKKSQDDAIEDAIIGGTDYHIVFDQTYKQQCEYLISWHKEVQNNYENVGRVTTKIIKANEYPLLQFTVLDFGDRQEVLIGWVVADENFISQDIFLIRSQKIANYFISLFRIYVKNGVTEIE